VSPARVVDGVPVTAVGPEEVLSHLEGLKPTVLPDSAAARILYLERAIHKYQYPSPNLHEALARLYWRRTLPAPGTPGTSDDTLAKLYRFLRESSSYDAPKLLKEFAPDAPAELRAILLAKMGAHQEALALYARTMRDPGKAAAYCAEVHAAGGPGAADVYLQLLTTYLKPPPDAGAPMVPEALALLTAHFPRIDPVQAAALLPEDAPVQLLEPWLTATLRHTSLQRRSLQIRKNLLKAQNIAARKEFCGVRNNRVTVDERTTCGNCGKRIGNAVFAVYPGPAPNTIVHYQCMVDPKVDPRTGRPCAPQL